MRNKVRFVLIVLVLIITPLLAYYLYSQQNIASTESSAGSIISNKLDSYTLTIEQVSEGAQIGGSTTWRYRVNGVVPACYVARVVTNLDDEYSIQDPLTDQTVITLRLNKGNCDLKRRNVNLRGTFTAPKNSSYRFVVAYNSKATKNSPNVTITEDSLTLNSKYSIVSGKDTFNYNITGKTSNCYNITNEEQLNGSTFTGRYTLRLVKPRESTNDCTDTNQTVSINKTFQPRIPTNLNLTYSVRYINQGTLTADVKSPIVTPPPTPKKTPSNSPELWFMTTSKPHETGALPNDYKRMFTNPVEWEEGAKLLDVYIFGAKARTSDLFEPTFLKNRVIPLLNKNNIEMGFDSGVMTWLTCRGEQGKRNIMSDLADIEKVHKNGGRVVYIRMQSSLTKAIPSHIKHRCPGYSLDDRISDIIYYIKEIRKEYPDIKFGLVDATTSHVIRSIRFEDPNLHYKAVFTKLLNEMKKENLTLDHITLDTSTENSMGIKNQGSMEYDQILELEKFVKETLKIRFGIIVVSEEGGYNSDELFHQRTVAFVREYKRRGGNPSFYFPESWYKHPWLMLPESDPSKFTHTRVLLDVGRIVKGK